MACDNLYSFSQMDLERLGLICLRFCRIGNYACCGEYMVSLANGSRYYVEWDIGGRTYLNSSFYVQDGSTGECFELRSYCRSGDDLRGAYSVSGSESLVTRLLWADLDGMRVARPVWAEDIAG